MWELSMLLGAEDGDPERAVEEAHDTRVVPADVGTRSSNIAS